MFRLILLVFLCMANAQLNAANLQEAIRSFVTREMQGTPGIVSITTTPLDASSRLGECANPSVFLPAGSRLWGDLNIGVRCREPTEWTVYLPVTVRIKGTYLVSSNKLPAGKILTAADISLREGDLTTLPSTLLTDPASALGKRTRLNIPAQLPLRSEHLVQLPVIRQGQNVRILAHGPSFSISSEGTALANALEGETIRIRTSSGQTITGIARTNGLVEIPF